VGYLIDPPERVEGVFVAVFAQTDLADELALSFLRDNGIDARPFPQVGDIVAQGFGGGAGMYGHSSLVCVPDADADEALDLLEFESGLVDFEDDAESDDAGGERDDEGGG
jgi:hypothetical protein